MSFTRSRILGIVYSLLAAVIVFPHSCAADYISLTASTHSNIIVDTKQVNVQFLISNHGDEPALNVAIEFPRLTRQFTVSNSIAPGESITHTVEMTFDDFSISQPGRYVLPFRLAYQDANLFPFSAPYSVVLVYNHEPPRMLTMGFIGISGALRIDLRDSNRSVLEILNTSPDTVRIEDISGHSATELQLTLTPPDLPLELKPGDKATVPVLMKRTRGQIEGSNYGGQILVSGTAGGFHFVESSSFMAKIVGEPVTSHHASRVALIALAVIVLLGWFFQRRSAKGS